MSLQLVQEQKIRVHVEASILDEEELSDDDSFRELHETMIPFTSGLAIFPVCVFTLWLEITWTSTRGSRAERYWLHHLSGRWWYSALCIFAVWGTNTEWFIAWNIALKIIVLISLVLLLWLAFTLDHWDSLHLFRLKISNLQCLVSLKVLFVM